MKSTIRNITVINVVCDGADEQALDSHPLCILLIAQCVTVTTILLFLPCLCPGAACSPDSNDTIYRGIKHHKPHTHTHARTRTRAHTHTPSEGQTSFSWQRQSVQFLKRRLLIREMPSRVCCWGLKFTAPRSRLLLPRLLTHHKGWWIPVTCHRGVLRSSHSVIRGWRCEHYDTFPGCISLWAWLGSRECLDISHVLITGSFPMFLAIENLIGVSFAMRGMCSLVHHWDVGNTEMCVHLRCLLITVSVGQWSCTFEGGAVLICCTSCFAWYGFVEFLVWRWDSSIAHSMDTSWPPPLPPCAVIHVIQMWDFEA